MRKTILFLLVALVAAPAAAISDHAKRAGVEAVLDTGEFHYIWPTGNSVQLYIAAPGWTKGNLREVSRYACANIEFDWIALKYYQSIHGKSGEGVGGTDHIVTFRCVEFL